MNIQFSQRQSHIITSALTGLGILTLLGILLFIFYTVGRFFSMFSNVFMPVIAAAILALVLKPIYDALRKKTSWGKPACAGTILVLIFLPFTLLFWFFGVMLFQQSMDLVESLPELSARGKTYIMERVPRALELSERYELQEKVTTFIEERGGQLAGTVQSFFTRAFNAGAGMFAAITGSLGWLLLPVYLAFLLMMEPMSEQRIKQNVLPMIPKGKYRDHLYFLGKEFVVILVSFFRGQLLIALIQGILFAIGFGLIGLKYGIVLGLLLGLLNIIPYLGNMIGLATTIPLSLLQDGGGLSLFALTLVVILIVQNIEGYYLTPKIMGDKTGLHPMVIMISMFFWGTVFDGIMGMMLAIPLTAFFVIFWRLFSQEYLEQWLGNADSTAST